MTRSWSLNAFSRTVQASSRRALSRDRTASPSLFSMRSTKMSTMSPSLHLRRARSAIGELAQSDAAFGLEADIDGDEIVGNANDRAFDDRCLRSSSNRRAIRREVLRTPRSRCRSRVYGGRCPWPCNTSPSSIPGETLPPVGQPVKSGGSTALKHRRPDDTLRSQSPLEVFDPPAATYGPEDRKPLRSMNAKAAAKAASASMSLVSRR